MSTKKLFNEDSEEEEVSFKTENEYAKRYDNWREKEELHKLEQKYGSKPLADDVSSSDSEDDDDPPEVSEEVETQFLKTLSLLKTKDPRIYDPNFKAFEGNENKKEVKMLPSKTLVFEDSDSESSDDVNIFKVEKKAEISTRAEKKSANAKKPGKEAKIKDFLTGKAEHIDEEVERDLVPLKALWSDPKLNEGEAFLRDYILNKRYLEEGDAGDAEGRLRDDEDLEEDERRVEEQGKFERAYNFRFEEPDDEFLKRYPRTMNYTRPKDDRRSKKRAEVRSRKEEEKRRKMEEIARLKALKLKEIQEKIAKIKEVTGNKDLAFKEDDIEGDFDPEEHDRRMKALFDEEFYGEMDDQKPVFPDLDEELEIENWDKFDPECEREDNYSREEPHCEDEDFNMDADYDPKQAKAKLIEEIQSTLGKKRRNRKKKSKLAELLATEKPKFVPEPDKTYDEYMEEYYKMDCEDVIGGDLPTRFKYREVVPNDYGLTIEEILLADDKELTQWVPLKKIVKHRPSAVEKNEVHTYRQKAADERVKRKILPSLFKDLPEEPELAVPLEETTKEKKKKKKSKEKKQEEEIENTQEEPNVIQNGEQNGEAETPVVKIKKKERNRKETSEDMNEDVVTEMTEVSPKKHKKKHKDKESDVNTEVEEHDNIKRARKVSESSVAINNEENAEVKLKKKHKVKVTDHTETSFSKNTKINTQEINYDNNNSKVTESSYSKKKKKCNKSGGFIVENIPKQGPSQPGHKKDNTNNKPVIEIRQKGNMKQKFQQIDQVPSKKKKFDAAKNSSSREKHKFKQNKNSKDQFSDHPLNKLSDERLKAYGLNPKKYRSFLKYKKF